MQSHIYHIIDEFSPAYYGVTQVISQLTHYLSSHECRTTILTTGPATAAVPPGAGLVDFPLRAGGKLWRFPKGMRTYLAGLADRSGHLFHLHGVWMAPQWLAARAASRRGVPAILSPHNMLDPWLWRLGLARRWKKLAYWYTLGYPAFRQVSVVHAITPLERDHLARHFPGQRLEVIPNAIDLEEVDGFLKEAQGLEGTAEVLPPYLLFLGRLHPVKGIDILIAAFARACKGQPCRLLIAGPESTPAYGLRLRGLVRDLGVEPQVTFLGPVYGPQKWRLYRDAWALCSPSHSEVVGLVNLEAAAAATPVITSHATGLADWPEGGGILVHPQVAELAAALEQVFSWSESEHLERGQKLRQLVERRYSWESVGPQWLQLYSGLL